jgi:hypothetical protein
MRGLARPPAEMENVNQRASIRAEDLVFLLSLHGMDSPLSTPFLYLMLSSL